MSSQAKRLGTRCESRVVKYLKEKTGIENIHRRELHGKCDIGDIIVEDLGALIEVKGGKQTISYPRSYFNKWINQTIAESANAGCSVGWEFLVVVQYSKAIKDAQVFESVGEGRYNFWYLDDFAMYLKELYRTRLLI